MRRVMPVDPILRIPDKAIDSTFLAERAVRKMGQFETDRRQWLDRREAYYLAFDDYISPVRKGLFEGSANFHFPLTEIQANAMHALLLQAMFFNYPWFYVDPQEEIDVYRIEKMERFMKYVLLRYANFNKGIYSACDDFAWDLTVDGMAIFNRYWKILQRKFLDVDRNEAFLSQRLELQKMLDDTDEAEFDLLANDFIKQPYIEKMVVRTVFNGPVLVAKDPAYILFKGDVVDSTDLNEHEMVQEVLYFSKNDLLGFKDSEYFDEEVVEEVLNNPPDHKSTSIDSDVRHAKDVQTGVNTGEGTADEGAYEFIRVYDTVSLNQKDKMAFEDRLEYFVHTTTKKLARWTYLDRVSSNGKIPLHMAHLYRRPRRSIGRGIVATMYPINDSVDMLLNQSIDAGMLANNPMFGYNGDSTFDPGEIRAQPGLGIKCQDVNTDLRFFTWNVNPNWSANIQGTLMSMAQQFTGIGPSQLGQIGNKVGALRSGAGVNALDQNASMLHEPIIKRVNECMSEVFEGLYLDCFDKMPNKLKITIMGQEGVPELDDDGRPLKEDITLDDLSKRVHFGLYANSTTINRDRMRENAATIAQFSFQKLPIETGIIQGNEVYEILYNMHRTLGTARPQRFLHKPEGSRALPIELELGMIMQGQMPPIAINDPDHQLKIDTFEPIVDSEQSALEVKYGSVAPNAIQVLKKVIKEHKRYAEMMKKPSNVENPMGNNQTPTLGLQEGGSVVEGQGQPNVSNVNINQGGENKQEGGEV